MTMNAKIKIILLIIALIVLMILQNLMRTNDHNRKNQILIPVSECHPQFKKCNLKINDLDIEIATDKDIFYLQQFTVSVWIEGENNSNIELIYIDFKMKNMNMGVNRFKLVKSNKQDIKQLWTGAALLPVCITGRADWFAELELITRENKYMLSFPIAVKQGRN